MSIKFYSADEDSDYYPHLMEDKWWEYVKDKPIGSILNIQDEKEKELSDKMLEESYKLDAKRKRDFEEASSMFIKVFWDLWD